MQIAHDRGITTCVSFEPVIDPAQTLHLIERTKFADLRFVGKMNHNPELEATIDWSKFLTDAESSMKTLGLAYEIKYDLKKAAKKPFLPPKPVVEQPAAEELPGVRQPPKIGATGDVAKPDVVLPEQNLSYGQESESRDKTETNPDIEEFLRIKDAALIDPAILDQHIPLLARVKQKDKALYYEIEKALLGKVDLYDFGYRVSREVRRTKTARRRGR